jgi:hypothetical protein
MAGLSALQSLGIAMLAAALALGSARASQAYPGVNGIIEHNRDDISGFTSLTGNDVTANVTIPFAVVIDGTS